MGELGAFLKRGRVETPERDPRERVSDYHEFVEVLPDVELKEQASRCMECGVPFCHHGCPVNNLIPDWNDLVYRGRWQEAIEQLHRTNNFPEFTGRLCPAPCEAACVLEIREGDAVTIKQVELAIIDRAWEQGWVTPRPPKQRTGRTVAVVGSGPSGLACAQQLARAGHSVTVYERDEAAGGLVRFGVPDFKIDKHVVERRIGQLVAEGVEFRYGVEVGVDLSAEKLRAEHEAIVLATGSRVPARPSRPRSRAARGALRDGLSRAAQPLRRLDRRPVARGDAREPVELISAAGRDVIVIGGGDTGADCVANAHREGARSVTQVELIGEPPRSRPDELSPWPRWPMKLRIPYALKRAANVTSRSRRRPSRAPTARSSRSTGRATTARRHSRRFRAPRRRRLPASCCSRWASWDRSRRCSASSGSSATRAVTRRRPCTRPRSTASSPQAMHAAASR